MVALLFQGVRQYLQLGAYFGLGPTDTGCVGNGRSKGVAAAPRSEEWKRGTRLNGAAERAPSVGA